VNATFISGGVVGDAIRPFTAVVSGTQTGELAAFANAVGAFYISGGAVYAIPIIPASTGTAQNMLNLDSSRVVPTGAENSSHTFSKLLWRRVA
jgi:hypothetical protein